MESLSENKRARFDYEILQTLEAGIELKGFEVKSAKAGRMNLAGAYAVPKGSELCLLNADIPPYQANNTPEGYDSKRSRRLLLKTEETRELLGAIAHVNLTIVALKVYNKRGLIKVELALAKPKKTADKRESIRKREVKREMHRALRSQ